MTPPEEVRRDLVRQWLKKANEDFHAVEILLASDSAVYWIIGFHCQQAVEKWMKGWLTWHGVEFRKTHDIVELLDLIMRVDSELAQRLEEAAILTNYTVIHRYAGDIPEVSRQEALDAVRITRDVRDVIFMKFPTDLIS